MPADIRIYRVPEVMDATDPTLQLLAGGNLRTALQADGEHLLRSLASFPAGSVSVAIRFLYQPVGDGEDPQQRLAMYLVAQAHHEADAAALWLLLERGPLSRFCGLQPVDEIRVPLGQFPAACDVVRSQSLLEPIVKREFNAKVPSVYWSLRSFEPRDDNDHRQLDSFLDRIHEPVLVEVCVEPADVTRLLSAHTRYLARLQEINRTWAPDDLDDPADIAWTSDRRFTSRVHLKPLRHRDPLADEVHRNQQPVHETLVQPHLRFHIRISAPDKSLARLLASVVAESAFADGSYQLIDSGCDDPPIEQTASIRVGVQVSTVPVLERLGGKQTGTLYGELAELAHLAPVDQLSGVFRFPVAGHDSPRCFRKSTDPPVESLEDLIVFGYEE